jgi:type II secretory pathway component PulF
MLKLSKKGNVGQLFPIVLSLVLVGLLLGAGLMILGEFKGAMTANSAEANATGEAISALGDIASDWLGIIVVVAVAGLVIFILLRSFGGKAR